MSANEHIDILKLHITNELFQQYAKALEKENLAKNQQNHTLYSQLKTMIHQNNQLKEELLKTSKSCSALVSASGKTTPIKKINSKMAQSQLVQESCTSSRKKRTQKIGHIERQSFDKNTSMMRTRITEPCEEQEQLTQQQILAFIQRVQQQTIFVSLKYQTLKKQRDAYLQKIKRLQNTNSNLQRILNSEINLRKKGYQDKQNDQNTGRNTQRCLRKMHPITGEDIIQFKPQSNGKIFFPEKVPKKVMIKGKQNILGEYMKQEFKKNEKIFINSYRDSMKKYKR